MDRNKIIHLHGKSALTPEKAKQYELQQGEIAVRNAEKAGESELYVVSQSGESQTIDTFITKEAIERYINSRLFVGTQTEYDDAWDAKQIAVGAVVIILEDPINNDTPDSGITTAVLGKAVLGQLVLGRQ
jgi:hypothetical protein